MYDLIGDVHGELDALERLLVAMEYQRVRGVWRHPERRAVFVGDLIDRGPASREVVATVRAMVEAGQAHCLMGNHEFNAIAFHTPDPRGGDCHLRPHSEKNLRQHQATLESYRGHAGQLADDIAWFQGLPFWLELDGVRVVHAAWSPEAMALVEGSGVRDGLDWPMAFPEAFDEASPLGAALSEVLKGVEWALPGDAFFHDKDGHLRREARVCWWDVAPGHRWPAVAMGPPSLKKALPDEVIPEDYPRLRYPAEAPPVFFGHYWLWGEPSPLAENVACLDYSVAKGGQLVAYRWAGEQRLQRAHFVAVPSEGGGP
ncbi:metallophosphoesterase [Natronospira bacteriovora]|uniref:Metallophosphoesterase n=1 Tax=Natronospira bacteriovora TaxID=3069753 RepID=A0ABU0W6A5_9GAMM|nr:metallophosphoesterase [Natronospira sp. AB-CW4]MDQ2068995.1 metallophosphoesterase [Natronospira sp. AB-CW4]